MSINLNQPAKYYFGVTIVKGNAELIVNQVIANNRTINIPVYQRRYSWRREQLERFVADLKTAYANQRERYFFGSLILNATGDTSTVDVIDGQQRLTTVSLFLIAIRDFLGSSDVDYQRVNEMFLIDRFDRDSVAKNRLHPVPGDEEQYVDVLVNGISAADTIFKSTYAYFWNVLQQGDLTVREWLSLLEQRLQVMNIVVDQYDDAQLIFESLNSTGMNLTESDKIRNFLLMGLKGDQQAAAFQLWQQNERLVGSEELSRFYRQYLTSLARSSKPVKENEIYSDYRRYVGLTKDFDQIAQLKKEQAAAKLFAEITAPATVAIKDQRVKSLLIRLGHLNNDILVPYLLQVFAKTRDGVLSADQLVEVLRVLLAYLARRLFIGVPTTGLNLLFAALDRQVEHYVDQAKVDYVEGLKLVLTQVVKENKRFPTDQSLKDALVEKDYYHMSSMSLWFILDELNNASGEEQDLFDAAQSGKYSIEHIMPRVVNSSWQKALGTDWRLVHNVWLNRLANLTLTGFNGQMSNRPYIEKRDMADGYRKSGIKLNQWVAQFDKWDEATLQERQADLLTRALTVWPRPNVSTQLATDDPNSWDTLDMILETNPTGTKPVAFSFVDDQVVQIKSWTDLYNQLIDLLWDADPSNFFAMANSDESLVKHVNEVEADQRYRQLGDSDVAVYAGGDSAWSRVQHIKRLLAGSDHDLSEVNVKTRKVNHS
ncbi:DUF262 domain-containing protein [Lacticaseibacillus paracasei]|uniref:DUF262 domain-containing protein n=1 Tax=Lacticaseibacillus paracasei TaxID=1597 RepID=UPI00058B0682|nr:DUF262 domain-containing protein [Lacticaseibacillus paracasei]ALX87954.1 hypothetical protein AWC33_01480 [Lacticaseibacillus paracasei]